MRGDQERYRLSRVTEEMLQEYQILVELDLLGLLRPAPALISGCSIR
jgi:hypothetical protein